MADIELPDILIKMERSCEEERAKLAGLDGEEHDAQWRRWREGEQGRTSRRSQQTRMVMRAA